jgi:outer membrane protein assembly factor BamD (BamD/ComL family)
MKKLLALFMLALAAAFAGCKSAPSGDEPVIEDQAAAQKAIDEADQLYDKGKYFKAYNKYEEGLRLYMRNPRRAEIVRREVEDIGLRFLDGTIRTGWFGTNLFSRPHPDVGVDIVRKVVLRNYRQGYDFLPDAQYKLATYLFSEGRYEEAQLEFEFIIKNFKDSIWTTISEFLIAECYYRENQGAMFDQATLDDAQEHFQKFLERSESGIGSADDEHVAQARERLETIRNTKAEKEYLKGEFYVQQGRYRAAAELLRDIPVKYPGTVWADKADQLLATTQAKIDAER